MQNRAQPASSNNIPRFKTQLPMSFESVQNLIKFCRDIKGIKVVAVPKNCLGTTGQEYVRNRQYFNQTDIKKIKDELSENPQHLTRTRNLEKKLQEGKPIYFFNAKSLVECESGTGKRILERYKKYRNDHIVFLDANVKPELVFKFFGTNTTAVELEDISGWSSIDGSGTLPETLDDVCDYVQRVSREIRQQSANILESHRKIPLAQLSLRSKSPGYESSSLKFFLEKVCPHETAPNSIRNVIAIQIFQETWENIFRWLEDAPPPTAKIAKIPPLPSKPLAKFVGGRGSDPIHFAIENYGVWINARVLDWSTLQTFDRDLSQKIAQRCAANRRRGLEGPTSYLEIFPSVVEARENKDFLYRGHLSEESAVRRYRRKSKS